MTLSNQNGKSLIERLAAPTYTQLWGVDAHLRGLTDLLTDPDAPSIIAIEGISGIGKTALANALLRHLIKSNIIGRGAYAGCAWITAGSTLQPMVEGGNATPQPSLTGAGLINGLAAQLFGDQERPIGLEPDQMRAMITHRLNEQPHLIVVDNLEALTESNRHFQLNSLAGNSTVFKNGSTHLETDNPAEPHTLLETIRQLVNPTRVLLTTRAGLIEQPDILRYPLPELSSEDALDLIRGEAQARDRSSLTGASLAGVDLASASDDELYPIVQAAGGNPLALHLIAAQPDAHTLRDLLINLAQASGKPVEERYRVIYQHAWSCLGEAARAAWLLMPIIASSGNGMSLTDLAEIAEQDSADLHQTLEQLVSRNLVDRTGDPPDCHYSIHPLARSFLQDHLLNWGEVAG